MYMYTQINLTSISLHQKDDSCRRSRRNWFVGKCRYLDDRITLSSSAVQYSEYKYLAFHQFWIGTRYSKYSGLKTISGKWFNNARKITKSVVPNTRTCNSNNALWYSCSWSYRLQYYTLFSECYLKNSHTWCYNISFWSNLHAQEYQITIMTRMLMNADDGAYVPAG